MEKQNKKGLLKVALAFFVFLSLIYGIGYLFFSQTLVEMAAGAPVKSVWLRWSGAILLGFSVGAFRAFRKPENQEMLVFTLALATLFCGLTMGYSLLFETLSDTLFTALPTVLTLACSALLWISLYQSKEILGKG